MTAKPTQVTLFDLDHTLLPIDSDHAWGEFTCRIGWTDAHTHKARNDAFYAQYQAGTLDVHEYIRFTTTAVRERGREAALAAREQFMREVIAPAIRPEAQALVARHRDMGERLAIITATNAFVTEPIAAAFGVELIAVDLALGADGWINGEIAGTPSFREGKVTRAADWLAAQGLDWPKVELTVYSDSPNDLPLLEKAQNPVATNPSADLRALAAQRGWRILDLFETP